MRGMSYQVRRRKVQKIKKLHNFVQILDLRASPSLSELRLGLLQQVQPLRVGDLPSPPPEAGTRLPILLHAAEALVDVV